MTKQKKDGRGSGSKLNVGRKKLTYETKTVYKKVPKTIHDLCCSLIEAEVQKYKNLIKEK
jgi:hypothetical protein